MKVPLRYQVTNYDCGPTSLLNGLSILFEREEIPPEVLRRIVACSIDWIGEDGTPGKRGTTHAAMAHLSAWLEDCGRAGWLDVSCRYLTGKDVTLAEGSSLRGAILRGGGRRGPCPRL